MSDPLLRILQERLGFPDFRPGQRSLIEAAVAGRDALGVLPTGGGKTLCFQLPALWKPGTVLVVSPLISLMRDQVDRATRSGLRARSLTSAESAANQARTLEALASNRLDLLFVSPERVVLGSFGRALLRTHITLLAVDEAHCISEWGHDFRPAFRRIAQVRKWTQAPVMAVTATATLAVREDIKAVLRMKNPHTVVTSFDRPNIEWSVEAMGPGLPRVRRVVEVVAPVAATSRAAIVYAPTRRQVVAVRRALTARGHRAEAYHAGLSTNERSRVQTRFMSRESNLIVATNAFGMGIDRSDVSRVIHFGMPGSIESYYQEAGRAGRDGAPSLATAFHCPRDWQVAKGFVQRSFPPRRTVLRLARHLNRLGRGRSQIEGEALLGRRGAHVPLLRWCLRGGFLEGNDALNLTLECWPQPLAPGSGVPAARVVGRVPRFDHLVTARKGALGRLRAIRRFATERGCRRKRLLCYLGEVPDWRSCGSCDRCRGSQHNVGGVSRL
ncbi:MAG: RecQ family ATP-dependent DNA helicase [Longimicrobiales bacterium]